VAWPFTSGERGRPDVVVDFVFERGLLSIAVCNIGDAPAYGISVTFDRQISGPDGSKPLNEQALFHRLRFMPPGKRIETFVDSAASYFASGQPTELVATVSFRDRGGKRYVNRIAHDLSIYRDIRYT
jgi:hypothetical protein